MKKSSYISVGCLLTALGMSVIISCSKSFLSKEPKGVAFLELLDPEDILTGAYAALSGASSTTDQAMSGAASVRNWVWDCASDDAYKGTTQGDTQPVEEIELYKADATNQFINGKWFVSYDGIARANDVLKSLANKRASMDATQATVIEAQAKFIRAWWHFRLLQVFWQVPYITESVVPSEVKNDRPIWDDIEADFKFAVDNLPESYTGEPGRATKWAAMAYMAYAHMFQKEYDKAKPLLDAVINSGRFDLVANFKDNYSPLTENNIESIFEIQSSVNNGTDRPRNGNADSWVTLPLNRFVPTCCNVYQPSQDIVNAFKVDVNGLPLLGINGPKFNETNLKNDMGLTPTDEFIPSDEPVDPRLDWTVGRRGIPYMDWGVYSGSDWVRQQVYGGPYNSVKQMFYKKDQAIASHSSFARSTSINYRALRFAHVLLWRAECAVEEEDLETAKTLINRVRRRASDDLVMGKVTTYIFDGRPIEVDMTKPAANYKLGEYTSFPSQEYGRAALRMELRLETALEGNRFFDLVRWGIDNQVLNEFIVNESQFRTLMQGITYDPQKNDKWPIPQTQLDLQPGILQQDPAY
ncbi:RagB/SusD family nutrient uptake outer membrane protein [Agriterribacter sp.]|uniref:RagB/SusD family nutrient uptake outer membrane protein n=1 Tax=Agriterribacter sp. TaxID=2821509 RepID=UPI002B671BD9|nr:RagB/SusD family nutrient uptake outer membrane protein [Agriterribacter sp.]HRN58006.1 RagB/SusD family nutrient uptake outer membrane protein [Agriterribacter sp.]HRO46941.1 RagB/SusD family nutrient uptake outer membrane protein [Agriterribacter sp.]HRQ19391.1 RagB/SusD family nutrient uptake outer membrane protein [Agriterribacter sp.]